MSRQQSNLPVRENLSSLVTIDFIHTDAKHHNPLRRVAPYDSPDSEDTGEETPEDTPEEESSK